jgi:hypothetical protein
MTRSKKQVMGKGQKTRPRRRKLLMRRPKTLRSKPPAAEHASGEAAASVSGSVIGPTSVVEHAVNAEHSSGIIIEGRTYYPDAQALAVLQRQPRLLQKPSVIVPNIAARGRVTLLAAREKAGKSTVMGYACAQVSRGGDLWGHPVEPSPVLWVGLEEFIGDPVRAFTKLKADKERVFIVSRLGGDRGFNQLRAEVEACRPALVVVDSLTAFARNSLEDENSSVAATKLLQPLLEWTHEGNFALVLLHHAAKSGSYRGSTAIGATVDMIVQLDFIKGCPEGRSFTPKGRFEAEYQELVRDKATMAWTVRARTEAMGTAKERIVEALADRVERTLTDLRSAVGGRGVIIDEAVRSLLAEGRIESLGHGKGYRLRQPLPRVA